MHHELERELADLVGTEASLTYVSCWNANEAAIPTLADENTVILSDELNHASIIDAIRLSRPARKVIYKHSSMDELREGLASCEPGQRKLVITDGIFSMEGDLARLPEIVELAREHEAVVLVDDSHGTGVMGETGRGVAEHFGLLGEIDVITSTLGKALGGAAGGFVAASEEVCDLLAQRSRPMLFSNALPPTVACSALEAVRVLRREPELVAKLRRNSETLPRPAARDRLLAARRRRGDHPHHRRRDGVRHPDERADARRRRLRHRLRLPGRARGRGADQGADVRGARGGAPRAGARSVRARGPRARPDLVAAAVAVRGLRVQRGGTLVFADLGLDVAAGRVTGLVGPNGAGKSTLIRCIVGVQIVEAGSVTVLGEPAGSPSLRARVGYVTQAPSVYLDLTPRENLEYFARVLRAPRHRVDETIAAVDLGEAEDRLVGRLSGGQRARVSLATALLAEPDVLVLDEPTVGLDPVLRHELWDLFHEQAATGKTILVSSHVMDEANRCDDLVLLREGRLIAATTPEGLRARAGVDDLEQAFLRLAEGAMP